MSADKIHNETEAVKCCSRCGEEKPLSEFGKNKSRPDGLQYTCRQCWSLANLRRCYPQCSEDDYMNHMEKNFCDCCGVECGGRAKHFDHCHETGSYRGTLCRDCNRGEGILKTSGRAKALYEYMLRNEQRPRG